MRRFIGTFLAAAMFAGTISSAFAVSTIAPNEKVYGYQSIDFETGYTVNEKAIETPLSGSGQFSKDGQVYCSVEGSGGTNDSVSVTVDGNNENKYLKIVDHETSEGIYANFKKWNTNSALNDNMDYFVLKCRMKNGDSSANVVKNLNIFRGLRSNDDGYIYRSNDYSTRYALKAYDWNDYMFVADKSTGTLYTAVNGKIIDSLTHQDNGYKTIDGFLGVQFNTSGGKIKDGTFYIDNIELYGVKEEEHEVTCTIEKDAYNSSVVYASFTQPVKFDASNIKNVQATVEYENGRYKITVANASAAGTDIIISGVTDIYGTTCADVHTNVTKQEKQYYQLIDFEKYDEGSSIIDSGNGSSDGIWYVTETENTTYNVVEEGGSKVLEVSLPANADSGIINAYNLNAASTDTADYFVIKYKMKNGSSREKPFEFIGLIDFALRRDPTEVYPFVSAASGSHYLLGQNVWNEYMFIFNPETKKITLAIDGKPTDLVITKGENYGVGNFFKEQWGLDYTGGKEFEQKFYLDDIEMYGINVSDTMLKGEISVQDAKAYVSFNHPTALEKSNITIDNGAAVSGIENKDGKYIVSFANLSANKTYNVKISGLKDMFGCELNELSASFDTGAISMQKNYLSYETKFAGKDDFESYDNVGIITSPSNPSVTITNKETGFTIDNTWTMNSKWGAEYALVKDGDNTVLKISVPGTASDGDQTEIMQPNGSYSADYTDAVKGNVYVYSLRFKSGSENEASFGETAIEDYVNPINLTAGTAAMYTKQAKRAFDTGKWVDFKYVIDWTGENQIHYAIADGRVIDSLERNLSKIQSSTPRIAQIKAIEGAVDSAIYIDDIEVYTTNGINGNLSVVDSSSEIKTGEGLTVQFNYPVASLTAENIENAPEEFDSITTLADNKCVINFKKPLAEGAYTIKLKNVEDVYKNTLESKEISFNVVSGGEFKGISDVLVVPKKDNTAVVTVTTNNTGAEIDGAAIMVAAYDENGVLTGVLSQYNTSIGMGIKDYTLTGELKGTEYKAFIWDDDMKPLCNVFGG